MRRVQRIKYLITAIFFTLLIATVVPTSAGPRLVGIITDIPVDAAAASMVTQLTAIMLELQRLKSKSVIFATKISKDSNKLISIADQLKTNMDSTEKWRESSNPSDPVHNRQLVNAMIIPMTEFKKIVNQEKTELFSLEANNFLSPMLSDKKNSAYTFGDTGYNDIIGKEAMCPPPDPELNTSSFSYAELQYDACRTVHNVMTYKKRKLEFTLAKKDQLEKAILAVGAVKDKTIGDHTAKKTVLAELKLLQQEVMDQYNAKMQFADVQIKASEDSRKYAAESIVGGSSVSAKPTNIKAFKTAAGLIIQTFMTLNPPVPYH
ncbi:MAG: hypothetical protein RL344_948 [Pseudomonadota bacterium]|jgi:hypothetical protein